MPDENVHAQNPSVNTDAATPTDNIPERITRMRSSTNGMRYSVSVCPDGCLWISDNQDPFRWLSVEADDARGLWLAIGSCIAQREAAKGGSHD